MKGFYEQLEDRSLLSIQSRLELGNVSAGHSTTLYEIQSSLAVEFLEGGSPGDERLRVFVTDGASENHLRPTSDRFLDRVNVGTLHDQYFFHFKGQNDDFSELWVIANHESTLLKTVAPASTGSFHALTDSIIFEAQAGLEHRLYRSDGTPDGTVAVDDLVPDARDAQFAAEVG